MSTPTARIEKYLSPKEIVAEMKNIGVVVHVDYVRAMLKAGAPHLENGKCMYAQFSRVLAWWEEHPGFAPQSEDAGVLSV